MKKIQFGLQLTILMLAFPVWFVAEMKQADHDMKKNRPEKQEVIEVKKTESGAVSKKTFSVSDSNIIPGSKLMVVNI